MKILHFPPHGLGCNVGVNGHSQPIAGSSDIRYTRALHSQKQLRKKSSTGTYAENGV